MDENRMLEENNNKPNYFERPLLISLILTVIYGFIAYLPELLDLENTLFGSTISPFASIFFVFVSRFTLSGILWIGVLPFVLYSMKNTSSQEFVSLIRFDSNQMSSRNILLGLIVSVSFFLSVMGIAILLGVFSSNFSLLVSPDYENGLGWFVFIFALIPGIWEEIAFRGFILTLLLSKFTVRKALILNGLLFSLFHIFKISIT